MLPESVARDPLFYLLLAGQLTLIGDLGGRAFGSYLRRRWGRLTVMFGLVAASVVFWTPYVLGLARLGPPGIGRAATAASGAAAALLILNYAAGLVPGVRRLGRAFQVEERPLPAGGLELNFTAHAVAAGDPRLPAAGLRLLLVGDLHVADASRLELVRDLVAAISRRRPDLVLLLGDYCGRRELVEPLAGALAPLSAPAGVFAVLGNHDQARWPEAVRAALAGAGIRVLREESVALAGPAAGLTLTGTEVPYLPGRLAAPPRPAGPGYALVACHSPDGLGRVAREGYDLMLSAHTHGGLFRLPLFGAMQTPTVGGRGLDRGWFRRGDTLLYVTTGIGYYPRWRLNRPEVAEIRLGGTGGDMR